MAESPDTPHNFRPVALIIAAALFMEQLDATVLTTALPTMARDFHVETLRMSLTLTSYLLSLAIFIPVSGRVADRFGAKRVFSSAIGVFLAGSILCGLSGSLGFLVFSRILQGIGGAMMLPVGRLVLLRTVPKRDLVAAMSWLLVPSLIGPVVGPMIGGFIVTYMSWRWIFYVNVPIGVLGIYLARRFMTEVSGTPQPIDPIGFLLSGISLSCLIFGLEFASHYSTGGGMAGGLLLVGLASGGLYLRHASRHPHPVLDFTLLRVPTFRLSVIAGSLSRITAGALPFMLPLLMQLAFGMTPARSGTITFATAAGSMLMKSTATPLLRRFGFRNVMIWNGIVASLFIAACALFRPGMPVSIIYAVLLTGGFFQSLQFTAYNTIAYADIEPENMSSAISFYTTFQQLMLSLGICFSATVLHITSHVFSGGQMTMGDFSLTFLAVCGVSVWASAVCTRLDPDAGEDMSGYHRKKAIADSEHTDVGGY